MSARRLSAVPDAPRRGTALIRVSRVGGREDLASPDIQRVSIEEYARAHAIDVVEWVEALDESAARTRSAWWPRLDAAVAQVEAGERDVVLVWKVSRAARHRRNWAVAVDRIEVAGGTIESATEGLDTSTSTGRLARGMLAELAAWESEVKGEQWKEAHARRQRQGLPHSGRPRFGYLYTRGEGYRPDPDRAPYLLEAYQRFARGDSVRSIVVWLNDVDIRTTRGGQWTAITLYRILDAGFGAGLLWSKAEDRHTPGVQEPVIDQRLWETYQKVRRQGRRTSPWSRAAAHTLSGIIRCGECGGPMSCGRVPTRTPGEWRRQYRCASHASGKTCRGAYIEAARAEAAVRAWVDELAGDLEQSARVAALRVEAGTAARQDRAHWSRLVARYDRQLVQLNLDRAEGLMPDTAAFIAARDDIAGRRDKAQAHLEDAADEVDLLIHSHRPVIRSLSSAWEQMSIQGRRDALKQLLRQVRVNRRDSGRPQLELVPVWERDAPH